MAKEFIQQDCRGRSSAPGEPPLTADKAVTVTIALDPETGKAVNVLGCNYLNESTGQCTVMQDSGENLPNCFFAPQPAVIDNASRVGTATLAEDTAAVSVTAPGAATPSSEKPQNGLVLTQQHAEKRTFTHLDPDDFLVLEDGASPLHVDLGTYRTEDERKLALTTALDNTVGPYERALLSKVKRPGYGDRIRQHRREELWILPHLLEPALRKNGTVNFSLDGNLFNGREGEKFNFEYKYNDEGKPERISINFPGGKINFGFTDGHITQINARLGERASISALNIVKMHGKAGGVLDQFIRSLPAGQMPSNISSRGITEITLDLTKREVDLTNFVIVDNGPKNTFNSQYTRNLGFSRTYNKFLTKDDTQGSGGLEVDEYLQVIHDILGILPFVRTVHKSDGSVEFASL